MAYYRVTLTFDRVFDVVRSSGHDGNPAHALFAFASSLGTYYGVEVPGAPLIESGHTITALLKESSNWQTLVGWLNRSTREIVAPSAAGPTLVAVLFLAASAVTVGVTGASSYAFVALPFFVGAGQQ